MQIAYNPLVSVIPGTVEPCRRELHARNADEPCSLPAPWELLAVPAGLG